MSLQIISSSPLRQSAIIGNTNTLFVEATSNNTPLTYRWYKNDGVLLIADATKSTYDVPVESDLATGFKVVVTDSANNTVEKLFGYYGLAKWKDGVSPATQVITIDSLPVAVTNNLRGTLHNYDSYYDLLNAAANFERILYGQIAYVHYDVPSIHTVTGEVQPQTLVKKYYKCNVQEPYTRYDYFNYVTTPQWTVGASNAKYWLPTNDGPGSGATAQPIMDNGYVIGINVTYPGTGYEWDQTTVIGVATNENIDVRNLDPQVGNIDYVNGQGLTEISISTPIGPFTQTPSIVIISGTYTTPTYPPRPVFEWTVGDSDAYDWQGVTFLNAEPDNDTIIIENGLLFINSHSLKVSIENS
jgi:hypothetical protein